MQKINYVVYDENNKVVAIGKDIDSVVAQAENYSRLKNDYGVRVYPILDNEIIKS
jgi:hypothetical protein